MEKDASNHPQVPSALLRATQAETELTFCFYSFFFFFSLHLVRESQNIPL